jgi:hypothetical protein
VFVLIKRTGARRRIDIGKHGVGVRVRVVSRTCENRGEVLYVLDSSGTPSAFRGVTTVFRGVTTLEVWHLQKCDNSPRLLGV